MLMNIFSYLMPLRIIRIRNLNTLSKLSAIQIIMLVVAAVISVGVSLFVAKKKPEWNGTKNKLITLAVALPLMALAIILF